MEHFPKILAMSGLLCLSALFSASETAFFSLSPIDLHRFRTAGNRLDGLVARLRSGSDSLLVSILLANNAVNILYFSMAAVVSVSLEGAGMRFEAGAFSIGSLVVLIAFAEVLPKIITVNFPARFARTVALPMAALLIALTPVRIVVQALLSSVSRILLLRIPRQPYITEQEIGSLIELSRREGEIGPQEGRMLSESLALKNLTAKLIMVPRVDVVAFDAGGDREDLIRLAAHTRKTKIPLYEGSRDNIIGIVKVKNLFLYPEKPLKALLEPVMFVPENMPVAALLKHLIDKRRARAVVVDEYGGTEGLVTLEDVLEEIVGEIRDEFDTSAEIYARQPDGTYQLNGNLSVKGWGEVLGDDVKSGKIGTFSGFISSRLGRLPEKGDVVRHGNIELRVLATHARRVARLELRFMPEATDRERGSLETGGGPKE